MDNLKVSYLEQNTAFDKYLKKIIYRKLMSTLMTIIVFFMMYMILIGYSMPLFVLFICTVPIFLLTLPVSIVCEFCFQKYKLNRIVLTVIFQVIFSSVIIFGIEYTSIRFYGLFTVCFFINSVVFLIIDEIFKKVKTTKKQRRSDIT